MTTEQTQFTGLATAGAAQKLAGYFGISVEVQRRIGTFIVLFSMIEQSLEFVLMNRNAPRPDGQWPTDKMTIADRFRAIRALAETEPDLQHELMIVAELGELLMEARHTVAHGAPIETARLEKNRSWLGEPRKRAFAALELSEPALDAAADAGEILYRLLNAIGARLAGSPEYAELMMPSLEELRSLQSAEGVIRSAMSKA